MKSISKLDLSYDQWRELRKQSVGASDVAVLLGLNPYKTAYQLWEEKILPGPPPEEENDAIHFGRKLEETVAQEYAERSGRKILRDNRIRIHPECDFFTCNLDRVILPANGEGRGVLECKTASGFAVKSWEAEIPPMYYTQVQAQLAITGYTWGVLALLVDGRKYAQFAIERDDKFIRSLIAIVDDFWRTNVLAKVPPPAVVSDYERVMSQEGLIVNAAPEVVSAWTQLLRVRKDKKELEGNEEQLENAIKLAIGTGEVLMDGARTLATWKSAKPSKKIDTKKLQAENPAIAAQYEITVPGSRRLLIKEAK